MRLAVPFDHGQIYGHFGRTAQFKLYDVTDGRIVSSAIVDTMGSGHGALAGFLKAYAVDALICGGKGGADDAVRALLAGALHYQPDYVCGHHKDEPPRVCGSHTCSAACYHETSEERSE